MKWLSTCLLALAAIPILAQDCKIMDNSDLSSDMLYSYHFSFNLYLSQRDTTIPWKGEIVFKKDTGNYYSGVTAYIKTNRHHYLYENESSIIWSPQKQNFLKNKGPRESIGGQGLAMFLANPLLSKTMSPLNEDHPQFVERTDSFIVLRSRNTPLIDSLETRIYYNEDCFPYKKERYVQHKSTIKREVMKIWKMDSTRYEQGYFDSVKNSYSGYKDAEKEWAREHNIDTMYMDEGQQQPNGSGMLKIPKDSFRSMVFLDGSKYSNAQAYLDTIKNLKLTDMQGKQRKLIDAVGQDKRIVKFWYIKCAPCQLADQYILDSMKISVQEQIININPYDSREEIKEYYQHDSIPSKNHYTTEFVYDKKLIRSYPTFVFYKEGELDKYLKGWGGYVQRYMKRFLDE